MKTSLLFVGFIVIISCTSVFAAEPYLAIAGGVSIVSDSDIIGPASDSFTADYGTGFGLNISGGKRIYNGRIEWEFGYKKVDATGKSAGSLASDLTVMSYMVNGYAENRSEPEYTPYLGTGIGIVNGELNFQENKLNDTALGYQVILGTLFKLSRDIDLNLSYRYQSTFNDFKVKGTEFTYDSSNIYAGILYKFDKID